MANLNSADYSASMSLQESPTMGVLVVTAQEAMVSQVSVAMSSLDMRLVLHAATPAFLPQTIDLIRKTRQPLHVVLLQSDVAATLIPALKMLGLPIILLTGTQQLAQVLGCDGALAGPTAEVPLTAAELAPLLLRIQHRLQPQAPAIQQQASVPAAAPVGTVPSIVPDAAAAIKAAAAPVAQSVETMSSQAQGPFKAVLLSQLSAGSNQLGSNSGPASPASLMSASRAKASSEIEEVTEPEAAPQAGYSGKPADSVGTPAAVRLPSRQLDWGGAPIMRAGPDSPAAQGPALVPAAGMAGGPAVTNEGSLLQEAAQMLRTLRAQKEAMFQQQPSPQGQQEQSLSSIVDAARAQLAQLQQLQEQPLGVAIDAARSQLAQLQQQQVQSLGSAIDAARTQIAQLQQQQEQPLTSAVEAARTQLAQLQQQQQAQPLSSAVEATRTQLAQLQQQQEQPLSSAVEAARTQLAQLQQQQEQPLSSAVEAARTQLAQLQQQQEQPLSSVVEAARTQLAQLRQQRASGSGPPPPRSPVPRSVSLTGASVDRERSASTITPSPLGPGGSTGGRSTTVPRSRSPLVTTATRLSGSGVELDQRGVRSGLGAAQALILDSLPAGGAASPRSSSPGRAGLAAIRLGREASSRGDSGNQSDSESPTAGRRSNSFISVSASAPKFRARGGRTNLNQVSGGQQAAAAAGVGRRPSRVDTSGAAGADGTEGLQANDVLSPDTGDSRGSGSDGERSARSVSWPVSDAEGPAAAPSAAASQSLQGRGALGAGEAQAAGDGRDAPASSDAHSLEAARLHEAAGQAALAQPREAVLDQAVLAAPSGGASDHGDTDDGRSTHVSIDGCVAAQRLGSDAAQQERSDASVSAGLGAAAGAGGGAAAPTSGNAGPAVEKPAAGDQQAEGPAVQRVPSLTLSATPRPLSHSMSIAQRRSPLGVMLVTSQPAVLAAVQQALSQQTAVPVVLHAATSALLAPSLSLIRQERQPLHVLLLHVELAQLAPMLLFTGLPVELLGADKQLADRLQCQGAVAGPEQVVGMVQHYYAALSGSPSTPRPAADSSAALTSSAVAGTVAAVAATVTTDKAGGATVAGPAAPASTQAGDSAAAEQQTFNRAVSPSQPVAPVASVAAAAALMGQVSSASEPQPGSQAMSRSARRQGGGLAAAAGGDVEQGALLQRLPSSAQLQSGVSGLSRSSSQAPGELAVSAAAAAAESEPPAASGSLGMAQLQGSPRGASRAVSRSAAEFTAAVTAALGAGAAPRVPSSSQLHSASRGVSRAGSPRPSELGAAVQRDLAPEAQQVVTQGVGAEGAQVHAAGIAQAEAANDTAASGALHRQGSAALRGTPLSVSHSRSASRAASQAALAAEEGNTAPTSLEVPSMVDGPAEAWHMPSSEQAERGSQGETVAEERAAHTVLVASVSRIRATAAAAAAAATAAVAAAAAAAAMFELEVAAAPHAYADEPTLPPPPLLAAESPGTSLATAEAQAGSGPPSLLQLPVVEQRPGSPKPATQTHAEAASRAMTDSDVEDALGRASPVALGPELVVGSGSQVSSLQHAPVKRGSSLRLGSNPFVEQQQQQHAAAAGPPHAAGSTAEAAEAEANAATEGSGALTQASELQRHASAGSHGGGMAEVAALVDQAAAAVRAVSRSASLRESLSGTLGVDQHLAERSACADASADGTPSAADAPGAAMAAAMPKAGAGSAGEDSEHHAPQLLASEGIAPTPQSPTAAELPAPESSPQPMAETAAALGISRQVAAAVRELEHIAAAPGGYGSPAFKAALRRLELAAASAPSLPAQEALPAEAHAQEQHVAARVAESAGSHGVDGAMSAEEDPCSVHTGKQQLHVGAIEHAGFDAQQFHKVDAEAKAAPGAAGEAMMQAAGLAGAAAASPPAEDDGDDDFAAASEEGSAPSLSLLPATDVAGAVEGPRESASPGDGNGLGGALCELQQVVVHHDCPEEADDTGSLADVFAEMRAAAASGLVSDLGLDGGLEGGMHESWSAPDHATGLPADLLTVGAVVPGHEMQARGEALLPAPEPGTEAAEVGPLGLGRGDLAGGHQSPPRTPAAWGALQQSLAAEGEATAQAAAAAAAASLQRMLSPGRRPRAALQSHPVVIALDDFN